ncbi:MAG: HAMP domain-containing protein [Actinobacteria bacterium]|nr:HAMP domain-containing protein [Actinomycetota bacterium]
MRRIATRLTMALLFVVVTISTLFIVVGIRIVSDRVAAEERSTLAADTLVVTEGYRSRADQIFDIVRLSANRFYLRDALSMDRPQDAVPELTRIWQAERLDFLTVTDASGVTLLRVTDPWSKGDDRSGDALVASVLDQRRPLVGTTVFDAEAISVECFRRSPAACAITGMPDGSGMVLMAAAPIFGDGDEQIGILLGGVLVNGAGDLAEALWSNLPDRADLGSSASGSVTIYQGAAVVATDRATGRALSGTVGDAVGEIRDMVIGTGSAWVGTTELGGERYLSRFEPISDPAGRVIGMIQVGLADRPYREVQMRTMATFLGIVLGGAILVLLLSLLVARGISRPIKRLVAAAASISGGDLDSRTEVGSPAELARLSESFNVMAESIQERDRRIAEFAAGRIKESERLAVVGQMAAGVAHELNNPLQGIVAYSQLLLEDLPAEDGRRAKVKIITEQADRCAGIIRALLDFSRPQPPATRRVDVNQVVDETVSLLAARDLFRSIRVVRDMTPRLGEAMADPAQLQQVLVNLMVNAAEAMDGGGTMTVSTRPGPAEVVVSVADTGPGISPENLERIFDPFFSTKEATHGTGLGLAISHGIIRSHHGSLVAVSEPGRGAVFEIHLPFVD